MLAISLQDRTLPCWLATVGHASAGCGGYGAVYIGPKTLERDFDDPGEFVCMPCENKILKEDRESYLAMCREMGWEPTVW